MDISQFARVGDTIETHVRQPRPSRIQLQLLTPEACAHANQLLSNPANGWTLVSQLRNEAKKQMADNLNEPSDAIQSELIAVVRRRYKTYFEDWNIHPRPLSIAYAKDNGEWKATVNLNWQRAPDYKYGSDMALFEYVLRAPPNGRERYWYCSSDMND